MSSEITLKVRSVGGLLESEEHRTTTSPSSGRTWLGPVKVTLAGASENKIKQKYNRRFNKLLNSKLNLNEILLYVYVFLKYLRYESSVNKCLSCLWIIIYKKKFRFCRKCKHWCRLSEMVSNKLYTGGEILHEIQLKNNCLTVILIILIK